MPILATKLFIPPLRPGAVLRPRLVERLNDGLYRKLILISAAAGFGKTSLLSEWLAGPWHRPPGQVCKRPVAWLSLDNGDSDPASFLSYLIAALGTIRSDVGKGLLGALQSPQPPPIDSILASLLNEITEIPFEFILTLDDYHAIDARAVDQAVTYLLDHLPPQMHLVIASREDPQLPLARLRARGQLTELRAADLRFTPSEAAGFLNQVMGLSLSAEDIAALETRTEGWIAGLQLAALSMQGQHDTANFIKSFTGSHHFVLDYLVEEVLQKQPESIQTFLLRTSILDRLCGPLCDAVLCDPQISGQATLEYLERANLFIIPLDNERHWYRYHHLFADFLKQRLSQIQPDRSGGQSVAEYHMRASRWYEDNGLVLDAFHHATAANDIERAVHLIDGGGMPIHSRSAVTAILDWLGSLPEVEMDARPVLRVRYATLSLVAGQTSGVEERLQAAETALQRLEPDMRIRNLLGEIAAARATLALTRAFAYLLEGDRVAAGQANMEALEISQISGDVFSMILATTGLGQVQEFENQLYAAAETYERVLNLSGDHPLPNASEAYLGLARIFYEWNDLESAEQHAQQGLQLARLYDRVIDRFIIYEVLLARIKLARGDVEGASAILAQAAESVRKQNFVQRLPEVAAGQVMVLLRQGDLAAAAQLAECHDLPISRVRVHLARGDARAALAILEPLRQQMDARDWQDERLKLMVLQAVAFQVHGEKDRAAQILGEALALAEPGGFIRLFIDEGQPMVELLSVAAAHGMMRDYVAKLQSVFEAEAQKKESKPIPSPSQTLVEPLSPRELEVLRLIAQGLSNQEICKRLFLALNTVKGHNRIIFDKLQVHNRTEAVARARQLGLL
jgi:LuxR family maltose regulon positive regulatory protein